MGISRRDFLKKVGLSAAALGIGVSELGRLEDALASPTGPAVAWLQGAGCSGCSVSFLNYISPEPPYTAADILIDHVDLRYHPTVMAAAGDLAVSAAEETLEAGPFVLVVEGGVPTIFEGNTCWPWDLGGAPETFLSAVSRYAAGAAAVVCVGNCASWGGINAAGPNPTSAVGVHDATGAPTINIAGCPPHPDWIVWALVQLLIGEPVEQDEYGRPSHLFGRTIHELCPRRPVEEGGRGPAYGACLEDAGCRGEYAAGTCPETWWNGGVNWCVNAEASCIGCTDPAFPTSPILLVKDDDQAKSAGR